MILYFSGTGNTSRVARQLATLMGDEAYDLTRSDAAFSGLHTAPRSEHLGLVFPVYAWGPPPLFLERLLRFLSQWQEAVGAQSRQPYLYALCTCGDDIGCTMRVLSRALAPLSLTLQAQVSVQMPQTYVALPFFNLDTPARVTEKERAAVKQLEEVAMRLRRKEVFRSIVPGLFPFVKTYVLRPVFNRWLIKPRFFKVADSCTRCGVCAKCCPMHNVGMSADGPVFGAQCAGCLSCYHHCPQNAIGYLHAVHKAQYRPGSRLTR